MANTYYAILTTAGAEKLAQAIITEIPVKITSMAVGDGNGQYYEPTPDQMQLKRETWRGDINDLRSATDAANHVLAEGVVPANVGGWTIREVGLFDDAGGLIAICNYPDTIKPMPTSGSGKQVYIQIHLVIDNVAALELIIDGSIVTASRDYVDNLDKKHRADLASHTPPGSLMVSLAYGTVYDAIKFFTPEMFGAVGDGVTDDYAPLQRMYDLTPAGAVFYYDGSKNYYNAFANDGVWRDRLDRNMWIRDKPATFLFNGAKLSRRQAKWADGNAKNNNNTGPYYTDQDTALLYITGPGPFYIDKPNFNGSNPIGYIKNTAGNNTAAYGYASCECRDYGLYIQDASDVYINDALLYRACFNIYALRVNTLKVDGKLFQSGQAWKMISSDLALGAGIKTINCTNVKIDVLGEHNTNATVEIEYNNAHVNLKCKSDNDYANTAVIYDSQFIDFNVTATNVVSGSWMQIVQGANGGQVKNIRGKLVGDGCSWVGLYVRMTSSAVYDMQDINVELSATGAALTAYWADQSPAAATGKIMRDVNVKINAHDNASGMAGGYAARISGDVRGETSGKVRNAYLGFLCDLGNSSVYGHRCRLDLTENVVNAYSVGSSNYVDWFGTITATEIRLMSMAPVVIMSRSSSLGAEKNYDRIWSRATYFQLPNLPQDTTAGLPTYTVTWHLEADFTKTLKGKW